MSEEEIMQALPEFSLQIQGDDTHPVISNFDDLKEWVNKAVDYAKGQITSTDAKDLKPVRAQLNKLHEKLEDARKNLKRRLEAPYKEWEIQYKDAVSSLLGASDEIGTLIKAQETRERDVRLAEIEKLIKTKADELGEGFYQITQKVEVRSWFFDKKWENKSTPRSVIEEGIKNKLSILQCGLAAVSSMVKPDLARSVFLSTGSLIEARVAAREAQQLDDLQKDAPLLSGAMDTGVAKKTEEPKESVQPESIPAPSGSEGTHLLSISVPDKFEGEEAKQIRIHRTISGSKGNIRILLDVAKSLGLDLIKITRN